MRAARVYNTLLALASGGDGQHVWKVISCFGSMVFPRALPFVTPKSPLSYFRYNRTHTSPFATIQQSAKQTRSYAAMDDKPQPDNEMPPDAMSHLDFLTLKMLGLSEAELRELLSPEELIAFRAFLRRDSADLDAGGL